MNGGRSAFSKAITAAATAAEEALHLGSREDVGRDEQRQRRHEPRPQQMQRPEAEPLLPPAGVRSFDGDRVLRHRRLLPWPCIARASSAVERCASNAGGRSPG